MNLNAWMKSESERKREVVRRKNKNKRNGVLIIFPKFKQYKLILSKAIKICFSVEREKTFRSCMICFIVKQIFRFYFRLNNWYDR